MSSCSQTQTLSSVLTRQCNRHIASRSSARLPSSCYSTPPPPDPNDPEEIEKDLKIERKAYNALVEHHGRPSHPIELGFDFLNNPGPYKDIISYWQGGLGSSDRILFPPQLKIWNQFRGFQQRIRRYHIQRGTFPDFQRKVRDRRRRHGLDGDVELLEDRDKQSQLDNWMEYQDYQYQFYERYEKDLETAQAQLESRQKALAAAGVPGFEGVHELDNFATYYGLAVKQGDEEFAAQSKRDLAERELQLAEKRLKAAQSDDLGETVERATWIGLFLKEAQSTQMRLEKLQQLAENAERDLEPYDEWWRAKQIEWWEEGKRQKPGTGPCDNPGETVETAEGAELLRKEFNDKVKVRGEYQKKAYEASHQVFLAKDDLKFAENALKVARSDEFGETVEKVTLIETVRKEVESAQKRVDEEKEATEKLELRGKVLSALSWVPSARKKLERHKILLEWIELQRREIAARCANTEKEGNQGQVKRVRARVLRNHTANEASRPNRSSKASGRKGKQSTARSILSPIDPSNVSKEPRQKRSLRRRIMNVSDDTSHAAEKATIDLDIPDPRSKRTSKSKYVTPASLRPIHSSRISKSGGNRRTGLRSNGTKLFSKADGRQKTRGKTPGMLSTPSAGRKAMEQSVSANASLRRSTRVLKKPARFFPG